MLLIEHQPCKIPSAEQPKRTSVPRSLKRLTIGFFSHNALWHWGNTLASIPQMDVMLVRLRWHDCTGLLLRLPLTEMRRRCRKTSQDTLAEALYENLLGLKHHAAPSETVAGAGRVLWCWFSKTAGCPHSSSAAGSGQGCCCSVSTIWWP